MKTFEERLDALVVGIEAGLRAKEQTEEISAPSLKPHQRTDDAAVAAVGVVAQRELTELLFSFLAFRIYNTHCWSSMFLFIHT